MGRSRRIRICWGEDERQLGKPGPTGRPSERMERRSGGKTKLKADSMVENSRSVRPSRTGTPRDLRWEMRFFTYAAKEKHARLGFGVGGTVVDEDVGVAINKLRFRSCN
ncbi:hypothetical protein Sjap_022574 [Stephania japonica]|uniref:Uncharacterized protein n=1 Tax=Stephania japonica TaxID=461633 RepID=A0AAP0HTT0_9MAGN